MSRRSKIIRTIFMVIPVLLILASVNMGMGWTPANLEDQEYFGELTSTYTYNAQTDFRSYQGYNGWYYQDWDGSSYQNMTWDSTYWKSVNPSYSWCRIHSNSASPHTNQPARKWVAPSAGMITITGNAYDLNANSGDGVVVKIYKNNHLLWYAKIENGDTTGYDYDIKTYVESGDAIYFRVDQISNYWADSTYFNPTIEHTPGGNPDTIMPHGATLSGTCTAWYTNYTYIFRFDGDERRQYHIPINNYWIVRGMVLIYESQSGSYPVQRGGTGYRKLNGDVISAEDLGTSATVTLLSHSLSGNKLTIKYRDVYEGVTNEKTITYELKGKTMVVCITSDTDRTTANGNYAGVDMAGSANTPNTEVISIPFMEPTPVVMVNNSYFFSAYLDKGLSSASAFVPRTPSRNSSSVLHSHYSEYRPNSAGEVMPLDETAYVTVTSSVNDLMPSPSQPKSAYRDDLDDRVVLDARGDFSFDLWKTRIGNLHDYGMKDLLVLYHFWQYYGYDTGMPAHYPARPEYSNPTDFATLSSTVRGYGYLFGAHEDYWFMDQDTSYPYWNPDDIARESDMSYRPGWCYNEVQHYAIACDKMLKYAQLESHRIKNAYGTNAVYLDVSTSGDTEFGWHQIDYNAANPNARTIRQGIYSSKKLFEYVQGVHEGPLLGEGCGIVDDGGYANCRYDSFYGGYVDGVERELPNRDDSAVMPDFELKKVRPKMANQGNGLYRRFFSGWDPNEPLTTEQYDKCRAMQIAYGHTGWLSAYPMGFGHWADICQEYYMMRALQEQYLSTSATLTSILYNSNGQMVNLDQALKNLTYMSDMGAFQEQVLDVFGNAQMYTEYSNGLKIYANHHDTDCWTVSANGTTYILPPNGWVAWNVGTGFLEYSALTTAGCSSWTASTDFSGTQGGNDWWYMEWDGSAYQNMIWDSTYWKSANQSYPWCRITASFIHPQTNQPARKWVAPSAGMINITGNAHDLNGNSGDGVTVYIYKNSTLLWSAAIANGDTTGYNYDLNVDVSSGDAIYFRVYQGGTYWADSTHFDPTIKLTRRIDYVYAPGKYTMIDGRGTSTTINSPSSITGTYFKVVNVNGPTVTEQSDGSLIVD